MQDDLQVYLEVRREGRWNLTPLPPSVEAFFKTSDVVTARLLLVFLGDSRTFEGVEPINPLRGFPKDCDPLTDALYVRAGCETEKGVKPRSFVTLAELAAFDWDKRNFPCVLPGDYDVWKKTNGSFITGIPASKVWPPVRPVFKEDVYLQKLRARSLPLDKVFYIQVDRGSYREILKPFIDSVYTPLQSIGAAEDIRLLYWFGPPPAPIKVSKTKSKIKPNVVSSQASSSQYVDRWIKAVSSELDEQEADQSADDAFLNTSRQSLSDTLESKRKRANELMGKLTDCGWFKGYPDNTLPLIERQLNVRGYLSTVHFDLELYDGGTAEEYRAILEAFSLGSWGWFVPENLQLIENETALHCSYTLRNEHYEMDLMTSNGWFDDRLLTMVNLGLVAVKSPFQFFPLPVGGDPLAEYALVDPAAHAEAERLGLLREF